MTRDDFYDRVTSWSDLLHMAEEYGYEDDFEDIVNYEDVCDEVDSRADNNRGIDDWKSFASWVDGIPSGYHHYKYNADCDEYEGLNEDSDLDDRRDELLELLDNGGHIEYDDEDDDGDYYDDYDEPHEDTEESCDLDEDEPKVEEAFPVASLISMCHADVAVIRGDAEAKEQAEWREIEAKLAQLCALSLGNV